MATPRVFISSTCYDLKYIRENLKYFVRTIGYEPILSEEGDIFYDPGQHTHDACIAEISTCQMMILIIGGRFGGLHKENGKSITNKEYEEALRLKISVFALIDQSVYGEHYVYTENRKKDNKAIIHYPSVDNIKIFEFIDEVRKNIINNAVKPFKDFSDIEEYLRKQWAGMMYHYLTTESEAKRVGELFESLSEATKNIEFFTRQMASTVQDKFIRLNIEFYDLIMGKNVVHDLARWKYKLTPKDFLTYSSFDDFVGKKIAISVGAATFMTIGGMNFGMGRSRYNGNIKEFNQIKKEIQKMLDKRGISKEEFLSGIQPTKNNI